MANAKSLRSVSLKRQVPRRLHHLAKAATPSDWWRNPDAFPQSDFPGPRTDLPCIRAATWAWRFEGGAAPFSHRADSPVCTWPKNQSPATVVRGSRRGAWGEGLGGVGAPSDSCNASTPLRFLPAANYSPQPSASRAAPFGFVTRT